MARIRTIKPAFFRHHDLWPRVTTLPALADDACVTRQDNAQGDREGDREGERELERNCIPSTTDGSDDAVRAVADRDEDTPPVTARTIAAYSVH